MLAHFDHRQQQGEAHIKRMERLAVALSDPRVAWHLYRALGRIVGTVQVEDVRDIACEALLVAEFYTPHTETEITGTLDVLELYPTSQQEF